MKKVKSISLSVLLFVLLIVCICAFNIKASANVYSEYLNGKNLNSGLVYEPTLILDLKDLDELNNDSLNYVTSVIMELDEKCDVIIGEKNYEFSSFFNEYIKGKYVPIVNLNKDNYKAFIKYYKETYTIYDLMVMSSDLEVLGEIYNDSGMYILNSVYDYRGIILDSDRYSYWKLVSSCNKVGCNIIMANANDSNLGVLAEYAQAMTKVVWGYGTTLIDAINSISSGCYGVSNTKTNNLVPKCY